MKIEYFGTTLYYRGVAYISGPISKMPELNKPAFFAAQDTLEAKGYEVLNPFELCQEIRAKDYATMQDYWCACMKACIKSMMDADVIFVLDGYTGSTGAMIEWELSKSLHIPVKSIHNA